MPKSYYDLNVEYNGGGFIKVKTILVLHCHFFKEASNKNNNSSLSEIWDCRAWWIPALICLYLLSVGEMFKTQGNIHKLRYTNCDCLCRDLNLGSRPWSRYQKIDALGCLAVEPAWKLKQVFMPKVPQKFNIIFFIRI